MTETFSILQYNQKSLVIKTTPDKTPLVICECYLPEIAETFCNLLTGAAQDEKDIAEQGSTKKKRL